MSTTVTREMSLQEALTLEADLKELAFWRKLKLTSIQFEERNAAVEGIWKDLVKAVRLPR